jgi:hypothetical protein
MHVLERSRRDVLLASRPHLSGLRFRYRVLFQRSGELLLVDTAASDAMREADAMVLVNVMRIPCFGRRMTIGRASIVWPGAS